MLLKIEELMLTYQNDYDITRIVKSRNYGYVGLIYTTIDIHLKRQEGTAKLVLDIEEAKELLKQLEKRLNASLK